MHSAIAAREIDATNVRCSVTVPPDWAATANGMAAAVSAIGEADAPALELCRVSKRFGDLEVVQDMSISLRPGRILSLLGPSGCGKTTVLRIIAGLLQATGGTVRIGGHEVSHVPAYQRKVGMVFQSYALFPHMTVEENVGFGLKMLGVSSADARPIIQDMLTTVHMSEMGRRYPSELSGGQQQRVSLARAIVTKPRLLLLDEPFGALDRKLREEMQIEVKQLQRELGLTFVFVTHDQEEALTLSDTIAVMRAGRLEQVGSPSEIFNHPQTQFVAEFFGALNTIEVTVAGQEGDFTVVEARTGRWLVPGKHTLGQRAVFGIRASDIRISGVPPTGKDASLPATLEDMIYKGTTALCRLRLQDGMEFTAVVDPESTEELARGGPVFLSWSPEKSFLFPAAGADSPDDVEARRTGEAK